MSLFYILFICHSLWMGFLIKATDRFFTVEVTFKETAWAYWLHFFTIVMIGGQTLTGTFLLLHPRFEVARVYGLFFGGMACIIASCLVREFIYNCFQKRRYDYRRWK